jgi:lipopolysaccharide/colanic/teichoic acid biosynthesis glycosyltransferase
MSSAAPPATPRGGIPRAVEMPIAGIALVLAAPVITLFALLVRLGSAGPAFFRQERVGRGGKPFVLFKLRSMRTGFEGPRVTAKGDARVTFVGRILRKTKLDELPQLWNVVRGDMSLVGPRPEVPEYVDPENPLWREILRWRPGITDPVTLRLRDEETVLAAVPGDSERYYREEIQPAKLREYVAYLETRRWWTDLSVLVRTGLAVLIPRRVGGKDPLPPPGSDPRLSDTRDRPLRRKDGTFV